MMGRWPVYPPWSALFFISPTLADGLRFCLLPILTAGAALCPTLTPPLSLGSQASPQSSPGCRWETHVLDLTPGASGSLTVDGYALLKTHPSQGLP